MSNLYSLDIETTGLRIIDDQIIGLSICNAPSLENARWYSGNKIEEVVKWLSENQIPVICWNALFDIGKLTYEFPQYPLNLVCDVAVFAQMADNSNKTPGFGLKPCIRKYLGYETVETEIIDYLIAKGINCTEDNFREFLVEVPESLVAKYCKHDAYYTYVLFEYLPNFIKVDTTNWMTLYINEVWATIEARIHGIQRDGDRLERARIEYEKIMLNVADQFHQAMSKWVLYERRYKHYLEHYKRFDKSKTGRIKVKAFDEWYSCEKNQFNLQSNTQIRGVFDFQGLYFDWETGDFDYPEYTEGKDPQPTFDLEHIGMYGEGGRILEQRGNLKLLIDRIKNIFAETEGDGRWHPDFNLLGTKSGRISSSGANILAFPVDERDLAESIQADDGCSFLAVDFRSLEPAVQAHVSGDKKLAYAIADGVGKRPFWSEGTLWIDDVYLMNISMEPKFRDQIDVDLDKWLEDAEAIKKQNKFVRNIAKGVFLSSSYGGQPPRVRKQLIKFTKKDWKLKDVKPIVKNFWASYPRLTMLRIELEKEVRTNGYFVTEFGFPLTYTSTAGGGICNPMHTCLNRMIQSSAAGVMKLFLYIIMQNKPEWMIMVIPDWHDATTVQVPDEHIEEGKAYIMDCLEELNRTLKWEFKLMLSMSVGKNLYATKE